MMVRILGRSMSLGVEGSRRATNLVAELVQHKLIALLLDYVELNRLFRVFLTYTLLVFVCFAVYQFGKFDLLSARAMCVFVTDLAKFLAPVFLQRTVSR